MQIFHYLCDGLVQNLVVMLFSEIVYGPIHSRRLGVSLGMNLMPVDGKLCSFNCIYCECGFNHPYPHPVLPTRAEVSRALSAKLQQLKVDNVTPDVITFSGNGEPTMHPDFEGIIEDTCALRDAYCPNAKVSVLSNSTQLGREDVVRALRRCDNRILKLDSGITDIIGKLQVFDGDFTLQTCFLRGVLTDGSIVDNTTEEELSAWYKAVRELRPKQVMIYVIDRATPVKTLEKISRERMDQIAQPLQDEGFLVQVSA